MTVVSEIIVMVLVRDRASVTTGSGYAATGYNLPRLEHGDR